MSQIRVRTHRAVVTLEGIVATGKEKALAESDAWYVFGVDHRGPARERQGRDGEHPPAIGLIGIFATPVSSLRRHPPAPCQTKRADRHVAAVLRSALGRRSPQVFGIPFALGKGRTSVTQEATYAA
ncbi:MAG: BON domain-containing protein [Thermodesulfobacteriota bacterium]